MDEPMATPPLRADGSAAASFDRPAEPADPLDQYRRWATGLFWVLAIFGLIVGLLALGVPGAGPAVFAIVALSVGPDIAVLLTVKDGSVAFDLRSTDPTARHGGVEAWASYAHGDRWLHQSDVAACTW
jgi:hypothetical protein